jgi:hypothetical protein
VAETWLRVINCFGMKGNQPVMTKQPKKLKIQRTGKMFKYTGYDVK